MELFKKAIDGNEEKLIKKIEVLGLWTCLQSRKVLNEEMLEECKTEVICVTVTALFCSCHLINAIGSRKVSFCLLHLSSAALTLLITTP